MEILVWGLFFAVVAAFLMGQVGKWLKELGNDEKALLEGLEATQQLQPAVLEAEPEEEATVAPPTPVSTTSMNLGGF